MIAPTYHSRLVGDTEPIASVILPERYGTDMLAGGAFRPLDETVGKKLPSMVVFAFMFVREGKIQTILIQATYT